MDNPTSEQIERFTAAYIECALWSSVGDDITDEHDESDIAYDTWRTMHDDCRRFCIDNADFIPNSDYERAGRDFWLTRCRHGAGFWDGDWPEYEGEALDNSATAFGNVDLYVGDDGEIHA